MFVLVKDFSINGANDAVYLNVDRKRKTCETHTEKTKKKKQTQTTRNSPESISTTCGNPLRILVAPGYAEYSIFTVL